MTTEQKVKEICERFLNKDPEMFFDRKHFNKDFDEWIKSPAAKKLIDELGGVRWVKASECNQLPEKSVVIRNISTKRATDGHYIKSSSSGKYFVSLNSWIGKRWELEETEFLDESPSIEHGEAKDYKIGDKWEHELVDEKWQEHSSYVGSDISELEDYAGRDVMTEKDFRKAAEQIIDKIKRP